MPIAGSFADERCKRSIPLSTGLNASSFEFEIGIGQVAGMPEHCDRDRTPFKFALFSNLL